ncbi:MAG: AbrB/MazE/SpoVT family DNA-binding domain-containing protein [Thaumarchaeota archaeon]|nr:AbrB/MazE/SpoVT family DNA-binding domain-containing protein [Nitrososphaerota archaeon]
MSAIVRVDEKGRILIPKNLREKIKLEEGTPVLIKAEEGKLMLEPLKSVADKYFGAFKVARWPEDLDDFAVEAMRKWWRTKST